MSRLIKVTFTSTSGEETTGFATLHKDDIVELPVRMALRVSGAVDAGEGYELVAQHKGATVPMLHLADARYRLDEQHAMHEPWSKRAIDAFRSPTKSQSEAYGRYCHTLSAAALVGLVGYAAGRPGWSFTGAFNCVCMAALAAILFVRGATLLKGDK
ncbi:hypothetical protein [Cupriavidus plantarum]|uniref:hypothetical protein n=1 Tax=Cupriavidus plantarum TaxID=942865 RepID=UPI00339D8437